MKRLVCFALVVVAACVGPARTDTRYAGKATDTAKHVISAIETARLAASASPSKATGQYLSIVLREAEEQAGAAVAAFDSIQPPSARSDELHDRLSGVMQDAVETLRELRIAVRRTQLDTLRHIAEELSGASAALEAFVKSQE